MGFLILTGDFSEEILAPHADRIVHIDLPAEE